MKLGDTVGKSGQFVVRETLDKDGNCDGYVVIGPGITRSAKFSTLAQAKYLADKLDAFFTKPKDEALKSYVELTEAFTALAAMEKAVSNTPLSDQEKLAVMKRVRENMSKQIASGEPFSLAEKRRQEHYVKEREVELERDKGMEL